MARVGRSRRRPSSDAEAILADVGDFLAVELDRHLEDWDALDAAEALALVRSCQGGPGITAFRERMLSGKHGLADDVHAALSATGRLA
jgi:hypothetical protein